MCGIAEGCRLRPTTALSAAPEVPLLPAVVLSGRPRVHPFQPVSVELRFIITMRRSICTAHSTNDSDSNAKHSGHGSNRTQYRPPAELVGGSLLYASEA